MGNSKEWREKQRILTDEELSLLIKNINANTKKYDKDIETKMEQSDRIELDRCKIQQEEDNIR